MKKYSKSFSEWSTNSSTEEMGNKELIKSKDGSGEFQFYDSKSRNEDIYELTSIPISDKQGLYDDTFFENYRNIIDNKMKVALEENEISAAEDNRNWKILRNARLDGSLKDRFIFTAEDIKSILVS